MKAKGIDVVIQGDPAAVHRLVKVVRMSLESGPAASQQSLSPRDMGPVVQPRELDELDSPYALPEAAQLRDDHLKAMSVPVRTAQAPSARDFASQDSTDAGSRLEGAWMERTDEATAAFGMDATALPVMGPSSRAPRDDRTQRLARRSLLSEETDGARGEDDEAFEWSPTPASD